MELFILEGRLAEISTFVGKIRATKDTLTVDYSVTPVDDFGADAADDGAAAADDGAAAHGAGGDTEHGHD
jgi:CopG family nickel-responsive transcriptional regulator